MAARLKQAKRGLDATATLTEDILEIKCTRCRGRATNCEDCWATGRREFSAGTGTFEEYALAVRLERQEATLEKAEPDLPDLTALPIREAAAVAAAPKAAPPKPAVPRRKLAEVEVPATIGEMISKADGLFQKGIGHLQNSKGSNNDNTWIEQGYLALESLRNAQTLYATAQETLDAKGLPVPRELIKKFRTNMQALVMARKQLP